jgi:(p)ppGpp synthase/HD superfamily hydrolase
MDFSSGTEQSSRRQQTTMNLSARLDEALSYAHRLHRDQYRKRTQIPYVAHLLSVAGLVLDYGGDEDQVIASLLHDSLEDQGERTSMREIAQRFGQRVAEIVLACSDTTAQPKPPWRERKENYLAHIAEIDPSALLGLGCRQAA